MSIPVVIIFEYDKDGEKIDSDQYISCKNIDDIKIKIYEIIKDIIKIYKKNLAQIIRCGDYYNDKNLTFDDLCLVARREPYNNYNIFEVRYYVDDKWNIIDRKIYEEIFNELVKK